MKILVVSDTHRSMANFEIALKQEKPIDMVVHLGDIEHQMADLLCLVKDECPECEVHMIAGNNDFLCRLSDEEEFPISQHWAFITHGHRYCVGATEEYLQEEARDRGADIVMYGHTHVPSVTVEEDLITLNPGSLTYPRQSGRRPSYITMEIDDLEEVSVEVHYL